MQRNVNRPVAFSDNDRDRLPGVVLRIMQPTTIHAGKTPRRRHYIAEWAAKLNKTPTDLVFATGADKGLVSRWLNDGVLPRENYLVQIAALFEIERDSLFRSPEDDWLARFFRGRSEEEKARARELLQLAFPQRTGTDN